MVLVYFIRVFFVWDFVFEVEARIRSPCFNIVLNLIVFQFNLIIAMLLFY